MLPERSRYDVPRPDECRECSGTGVSLGTEGTGYYDNKNKRYVTVSLGSGCPVCLGIGRVPWPAVR